MRFSSQIIKSLQLSEDLLLYKVQVFKPYSIFTLYSQYSHISAELGSIPQANATIFHNQFLYGTI